MEGMKGEGGRKEREEQVLTHVMFKHRMECLLGIIMFFSEALIWFCCHIFL